MFEVPSGWVSCTIIVSEYSARFDKDLGLALLSSCITKLSNYEGHRIFHPLLYQNNQQVVQLATSAD